MRATIVAAILAASTGLASAEFYVMQNTQTQKCSIEEDYAASPDKEVLLKNKFIERSDAEAAMRDVPGCS